MSTTLSEDNFRFLVDRLNKIETTLNVVVTIQENINVLQSNVEAVVASQALINEKFEAQEKTIKELQTENKKNIKIIHELQTGKMENDIQLKKVNDELNNLEQYGRRNMVDIRGIPRSISENTDKIVLNVANLMQANISTNDIEVSHRTSTSNDAAIIVKFFARKKRGIYIETKNTY